MTISDAIILYFSLGTAVGIATRGGHAESRGEFTLGLLMTSLIWPLILSKRALEAAKRRLSRIDEMSDKKSSIREALAGILESEKPGISLVRAREVIDCYVELAEAVNEMKNALESGVEFFPELISVSGKSSNHISASALERKNMRVASKHLRIARECLVEGIMSSEFLQPAERDFRRRLLEELSGVLGDERWMSDFLEMRFSPTAGKPMRVITTGKPDTASVEG